MSRITNYVESLNKYLTKVLINTDETLKSIILNAVKRYNFIIPTITLTILNNLNKKFNHNTHGYYIACIISLLEVLYIEHDISDTYKDTIIKLINKLITDNNVSLNSNSDDKNYTIQYILAKINGEPSVELKKNNELLKEIPVKINKLINDNLEEIHQLPKFTFVKNIIHSVNYNFEDDDLKTKLKTLKIIQSKEIIDYVGNSFGIICELAVKLSYIIGNYESDHEHFKEIGKILALLLHIGHDFKFYEEDISKASIYSLNIVINIGIQRAFELFDENKSKFIELCINNDIYTKTVKEILKYLNTVIVEVIEKSNVSLTDTLSGYSSIKKKTK